MDRQLRGELEILQPHDDSTPIERVLKEGDAGTEILRSGPGNLERLPRDGNSRTNGAGPASDGQRGRVGVKEGALSRPHGETPFPRNQRRRAFRLSPECASRTQALCGATKPPELAGRGARLVALSGVLARKPTCKLIVVAGKPVNFVGADGNPGVSRAVAGGPAALDAISLRPGDRSVIMLGSSAPPEETPPRRSNVASQTTEESLKPYEAAFRFADRDYYDRHLVFDHVVTMEQADQRQRFEAVAHSLRDLLTQRWLLTQATHDRANPKQVYYLSMEFLIGRTLLNSITNLEVEPFVDERPAVRYSSGLAPASRGRARRWPGQRRPGTAGGLLPRLAGDPRDSGHRLRAALRVRHVPSGNSQWAAVRAARQLVAPARPLGGSQGRARRSRSR